MSNIRKLLTPDEALSLGFQLNTPQVDKIMARYMITPEQWLGIIKLRNQGVIDSCEGMQVNPENVKHLWKKDKESSLFVKNPLYVSQLEKTSAKAVEAFLHSKENGQIARITHLF